MPESKAPGVANQELVIIDYRNPTNPVVAGRMHLPGQHAGEAYRNGDRFNPDGSPQKVWCHEITLHNNRLYIACAMLVSWLSTWLSPRSRSSSAN
jgi:hypothetical protein